MYCSTTVGDVARYFVAHAVIIKLCYQGSVLSILSECVKNVLTQPNVKKSFLKSIWRPWWLVSKILLVYDWISNNNQPWAYAVVNAWMYFFRDAHNNIERLQAAIPKLSAHCFWKCSKYIIYCSWIVWTWVHSRNLAPSFLKNIQRKHAYCLWSSDLLISWRTTSPCFEFISL